MPKTINTSIEEVLLGALKIHPRNANQGDFGAIQQSVEANGFYGTVVANKRTGHILAGNHRFAVAKSMGFERVPVAWVDVDDEEELRILIADNRTTRLGIDNEAQLAELLSELAATPAGLLGTGFDGDDLDDLIGKLGGADALIGEGNGEQEAGEAEDAIDDVPELPHDPITKPGDVWLLGKHRLICGDSSKRINLDRALAGEAPAAVVTDPPYGLAFMGKRWDYDVPSVDLWSGCLDVLRPGGHLLAFAGTRTQHRMAVRIEDAGFEIRDMIAWVYGSGFPKSMDVSKAIDKADGHWRGKAGAIVTNNSSMEGGNYKRTPKGQPVTEGPQTWSGWGTALKPALEPITVARKPFDGTVADNVLEHGTGAINIDACRIGTEGGTSGSNYQKTGLFGIGGRADIVQIDAGRWPANLIHDGSDEVVELFPESSSGKERSEGIGNGSSIFAGSKRTGFSIGDSGSAARFFYCAKAARSDRGEDNNHPTVKPVALMEYLIKLVTPNGDLILEPFGGSGTTLIAAERIGARCAAIEMNPQYCDVIVKRWETLTGQKAVLEANDGETD